jgi:hypothetical protein
MNKQRMGFDLAAACQPRFHFVPQTPILLRGISKIFFEKLNPGNNVKPGTRVGYLFE